MHRLLLGLQTQDMVAAGARAPARARSAGARASPMSSGALWELKE